MFLEAMTFQGRYTTFAERFNDTRWNECSFKDLAEHFKELGLANPHIGGMKHIKWSLVDVSNF